MKRTEKKGLPRNPYVTETRFKPSAVAMKASKHASKKQARLTDKQAIREGLLNGT